MPTFSEVFDDIYDIWSDALCVFGLDEAVTDAELEMITIYTMAVANLIANRRPVVYPRHSEKSHKSSPSGDEVRSHQGVDRKE